MTDLDFSRIHRFTMGGMHLVLDINSGSVHVLDDTADDYLTLRQTGMGRADAVRRLAETVGEEDAADVAQGIDDLINAGMLFSDIDFSDYRPHTQPIVKALCLHLAHDCNLRCQYCFASTGDFGTGRKLMPVETGKKAIDFLLEQSGDRKNLELDFFGGEPLMNFDAVKEIVKYARSREAEAGKRFRFTITTNGVLLDDDKIAFINQEMSNVVLSVDGRKEVHDRMRPAVNGKGSYDVILPKFKKLVENRSRDKDWYVRGTFTKYNLDFSEDVFSLYEQGFDQISVEPVVADPKYPYALTEADIPAISAEYERLAQRLLENDRQGKHFNFFHFMIDLDQGPCAVKRLRGCGCGNEYVAVTPDGDIYPCHQFVGNEAYKMGNLEEGTFDTGMKERFAQTHIYNKPSCRECWARFYCSGGCNANNYQYMGDVLKAHTLSCEFEKKRVECAIMMQAVKSLEKGEAE